MYKLLLADDESDIRDGLMEVIHFEKYGFTVVGQAENGLEALRLCEEQEPDLIVSDIRMPLMDGLTMLAEAEKALPTVRSIILSGYDEFEFARPGRIAPLPGLSAQANFCRRVYRGTDGRTEKTGRGFCPPPGYAAAAAAF